MLNNLITDRTLSDVQLVQALNALDYAVMSLSQQADWDSDLKGAYNASDLNRVENAVDYLAGLLTSYGYSLNLTTKTDWADTDIPTSAQMDRYLNNIIAIRSALTLSDDAPPAPDSMDYLTYESANNIERIMQIVESLIDNMTQIFVYSGQPYSGQIWEEFTA